MTPVSIAILGAGLSGLACAQQLLAAGLPTCVFDKARGPGGRLASRRRQDLTFDLGAQQLVAQDTDFQQQLASWQQQGWIQPWKANSWVAVPRMNALSRHLSQSLNLYTEKRILGLEQQAPGQWVLVDQNQHHWGPFSHLVIATPAAQARSLLSEFPELLAELNSINEQPQWVTYCAFPGTEFQPDLDQQPNPSSALARATLLNSKPGQATPEQRWVLEATTEWSQQHLEKPAEEVAQLMYKAGVQQDLLPSQQTPLLLEAHRWLYAHNPTPLKKDFLSSNNQQVFVCGDYCLGSDLQAAWQSGTRLGNALRKTIQ